MNVTARNVQLTPTLWKRVSIREDGEEDQGVFGTFAEILDITMPLVLGKDPIELGCGCSDDCPSPKVFIGTQNRQCVIDVYSQFVQMETERADNLHLNIDDKPACGVVIPDPEDIPNCQIKRLILPEYWMAWDGQQCPDCIALLQSQPDQQQQSGGDESDGDVAIPEAFAVCTYLMLNEIQAQGWENLARYPGILSIEFEEDGSKWEIRAHAQHDQTIDDLPPYTVYVLFNGWPAGMIAPNGGTIAAGDVANEESFIGAVRAELVRRNVEI